MKKRIRKKLQIDKVSLKINQNKKYLRKRITKNHKKMNKSQNQNKSN
jgi:hypothetical protein